MCGALRLARFNVQTKKPAESSSKRYFVGLPIPAGAGMIAAVVHFFKTPTLMIGSASFWWGVLIVVVAFLMISTVRYSSFKEFDVKKAKPSLALVRDSNADRTDLLLFGRDASGDGDNLRQFRTDDEDTADGPSIPSRKRYSAIRIGAW